MRILFACHRLPFPPKRGGKIRPFNIIRHFHQNGCEVTVGSLSRSREELEEGQGLRDYCEKLLVGTVGKLSATTQMLARLPTFGPSTMGYFYSAELHRLMRVELQTHRFDLIFVHCSSAAQYVADSLNTASILDFGDMDSQKWLSYSSFKAQPFAAGYWLEGIKLARAEKRLAAQFDACTCTTRAELETLDRMCVANTTNWFPNGVDADYFSPSDVVYDANEISFIGRMDYYPNQQGMFNFCRSVLPRIQERRPATTLTIVGANPSEGVRALGNLPGVTVTGTVDDVRPFVRKSVLTIAPLSIARGTQNKILESMAMGVPVVSSEIAAKGVDAISGEHLLATDEPEIFADHVLTLLDDAATRAKYSRAGRKRVLERHSWQASMQKLDTIVSTAQKSRQ